MSTKIYNAFRVKRGVQLWPLLWAIKKKGIANIQQVLVNTYNKVLGDPQSIGEMRTNLKMDADYEVGPDDVSTYVKKLYRAQLGGGLRNPFNFDVSLSVRELRGRYYLITYCDGLTHDVLKFLQRDRRVEDFHYQNQTDRPEKISERAWRVREKTWDKIDKAGWKNFLILDICSYDAFPYIDPAWNFGKENPWHHQLKELSERREAKRKAASAASAASTASPGATTAKSPSADPAPASNLTTPSAPDTTTPGPTNPSPSLTP